jgi:hypothetical protein
MPRTGADSELSKLRRELRLQYRRISGRPDAKITAAEELIRLSREEKRERTVAPPDVIIWLTLYDEFLAWLLFLLGIYLGMTDDVDKHPNGDQLVCCAVLTGRIFQDSLAIRETITSGFDVAAKCLSRTVAESIDVLSLVHLDKEAAKIFRNVDNNERANLFWHKFCSREKIDRKIQDRWRRILSDQAAAGYATWRKEYTDLVGMSVHPSFPAAVASILDSNNVYDNKNVLKNAFGYVSHMSRFTMHFIMKRIYEFGRLFVADYFTERSNLFDWKTLDDEVAKAHVQNGLKMLSWIMLDIERPERKTVYFPEIRTYWIPKIGGEQQA